MANIKNVENVIKANIINNSANIKTNVAVFKSATTEQSGIIRIATEEEVRIGKNNSTAVTPYTLNNLIKPIQIAMTNGITITLLEYNKTKGDNNNYG